MSGPATPAVAALVALIVLLAGLVGAIDVSGRAYAGLAFIIVGLAALAWGREDTP